jgi:hypothetical protein
MRERVIRTESGDTLRTIAGRVFGDSTLWYLIAQENGLTDPDAAIAAGTELNIPNQVVSLHNNAQTFKPFDASQALGDTSPSQPFPPPPHHGGCGLLGEILVVIVAVVVTIYTAGATSEALGAALSGAVGAAAGSVASQAVALAIGQQSSFSWSAVGYAAIGGAIGGEVSEIDGLGTFGQAIASNVADQGVDIALGEQKSFNWEAVAAAAVAAPLAVEARSDVQSDTQDELGAFGSKVAGSLASSAITQTTQAAFTGGKINYVQIIADGFGNPIAQSALAASGLPANTGAARVTAQRASTAAGESETAQDAPLTNNQDLLSDFQPQLQDVTFDPDSLSLPSIQIGVGPEGARGFWGVAQSLLGSGASNAQIQNTVLQLITANPNVTTLHEGDVLNLGDGSISAEARATDAQMNANYQAQLAATAQAQAAATYSSQTNAINPQVAADSWENGSASNLDWSALPYPDQFTNGLDIGKSPNDYLEWKLSQNIDSQGNPLPTAEMRPVDLQWQAQQQEAMDELEGIESSPTGAVALVLAHPSDPGARMGILMAGQIFEGFGMGVLGAGGLSPDFVGAQKTLETEPLNDVSVAEAASSVSGAAAGAPAALSPEELADIQLFREKSAIRHQARFSLAKLGFLPSLVTMERLKEQRYKMSLTL